MSEFMFQSGGNISQPFKFGETVMAQCLRVLAALPEDHPHQGPSLLITAEAPGLFSGLQGHKHVLAHSCTHTYKHTHTTCTKIKIR